MFTISRSLVLSLLSTPANTASHKILIFSHLESHISSSFAELDIRHHFEHLSPESWDTKDAIGALLRAKLDEILHTHPLMYHLSDCLRYDPMMRGLDRASCKPRRLSVVQEQFLYFRSLKTWTNTTQLISSKKKRSTQRDAIQMISGPRKMALRATRCLT